MRRTDEYTAVYQPEDVRRWSVNDMKSALIGKLVTVWRGNNEWSSWADLKVTSANLHLGGISVVVGKPGDLGYSELGLATADEIAAGVTIAAI